MILRRLLVAAVTAILALQVLRQGVVDAFAGAAPRVASAVWPGHPDVEITRGMIEIAERTRQGRPVTDSAIARVFAAARSAPLAPEPYLVRGIQAQLAGDFGSAERAFLAAKERDPVSLPARYFLADQYLRRGDAQAGLREIAVLARLAPGGVTSLAPYVAAYARQRAVWPQLRALFRAEPQLERAALQALAADPANAETVMALATRRGPGADWLPAMIGSLVKAKKYAEARRLWASVAGVEGHERQFLYDGDFARAEAPPPFNWALTSSAVGLAERVRGGGLHVIYHGREDGVLAAQMILLPPGRYRMDAPAGGTRSDALHWALQCASDGRELARRAVKDMAGGWVFDVPADCPAQRLQLVGSAGDMPQPADVTIRSARLQRVAGGA